MQFFFTVVEKIAEIFSTAVKKYFPQLRKKNCVEGLGSRLASRYALCISSTHISTYTYTEGTHALGAVVSLP